MRIHYRTGAIALVLLALVGGTAACSSGGDDVSSVDDVWSRSSMGMENAAAVYMTISGGEAGDSLVGVAVDPSIAAMAQLHETTMSEDSEGVAMMGMEHVDAITVPSNGEVLLEPGGFHVMLMNLSEPLEIGSEFEVTLTFASAGEMIVTAEVRES